MIVKRNENTAELVGLSFGDGGLTYRKGTNKMRFQMAGDGREDKEHYDNYIIPLFNKEIMIPIFNRGIGIIFNKKSVVERNRVRNTSNTFVKYYTYSKQMCQDWYL